MATLNNIIKRLDKENAKIRQSPDYFTLPMSEDACIMDEFCLRSRQVTDWLNVHGSQKLMRQWQAMQKGFLREYINFVRRQPADASTPHRLFRARTIANYLRKSFVTIK